MAEFDIGSRLAARRILEKLPHWLHSQHFGGSGLLFATVFAHGFLSLTTG